MAKSMWGTSWDAVLGRETADGEMERVRGTRTWTGLSVKHLGPGNHPDGSSQKVHGGGRGGGAGTENKPSFGTPEWADQFYPQWKPDPTLRPSMNAALGLDYGGVMRYQVEMRPEEARVFASRAYEHPQSKEEFVGLIDAIDASVPRMSFGQLNGAPNANNGKPFHTYRLGKEYSRVVYVDLPKNYAPSADWVGITQKLNGIAKQFGANEFDVEQDELNLTARFWWD